MEDRGPPSPWPSPHSYVVERGRFVLGDGYPGWRSLTRLPWANFWSPLRGFRQRAASPKCGEKPAKHGYVVCQRERFEKFYADVS